MLIKLMFLYHNVANYINQRFIECLQWTEIKPDLKFTDLQVKKMEEPQNLNNFFFPAAF